MTRHLAAADHQVVTDVAHAIEGLQARGICYGDIFSPMHLDGLRDVARRMTVTVKYASIGVRDLEAVASPVFGRYLMIVSSDVDDARRGFALRHGLGHVAAGHVTSISFLRSLDERNDYMAREERVADLFALADLVPWCLLDDLRHARTSWGALRQMLCRVIRTHTIDWPSERVLDRADLRLALYRAETI